MLSVALSLVVALPPADDGLAAVRKRFGETNLPNGSTAEVFDGPRLRLRLPAGRWRDPKWGEGANIDFVPWTARRVEGDFEAEVRVRLLVPQTAGAAGVTTTFVGPEGVTTESTPAVNGGLYLSSGGRERVNVYAIYERRGDQRTGGMSFGLSTANMGAGGGCGLPYEPNAPTWLAFRRVGGKVQFRGGSEQGGRPAWGDWFKYDCPMPEVVDLRLYATGNLDKPFTVEFDRLTVTPIAGEKK